MKSRTQISPSTLLNHLSVEGIASAGLLLLASCLPLAQACSYSETYTYYYYSYYYNNYSPSTYYNYDVCNGGYCSADVYCESYKCSGNVCKSRMEAWMIFLIVFFSTLCFFMIIRCLVVACRKKRHHQSITVIRNEHNRHQFEGAAAQPHPNE